MTGHEWALACLTLYFNQNRLIIATYILRQTVFSIEKEAQNDNEHSEGY